MLASTDGKIVQLTEFNSPCRKAEHFPCVWAGSMCEIAWWVAGGLPIVQGSGSTAAAVVWRSVIANASSSGNALFSLTYDAVGSGQVGRLDVAVHHSPNFTEDSDGLILMFYVRTGPEEPDK